jgi:uncharacterized protein (DUF488 family)
MKIFTLGHSTRKINEFLDILANYEIRLILDVRLWPTSRRFPWFGKEELKNMLESKCIEYIHFPELGGYRKEGYEAYSKSREFNDAINRMLDSIGLKTASILCAEKLWSRCHRKYIAEYLAESGSEVVHILDLDEIHEHKGTSKEIEEKMNLVIWCDKKATKRKS